MGKSRYKLTGGKKNGFASFPKTLVEAIFWDKKKQPLEEVLDGKIDQPLDPAYVGKVPQVAQDGTVDWVVPLAGSTADSAMSDSSTNAPQNKIVKAYVDAVGAEVSQLGQKVDDIDVLSESFSIDDDNPYVLQGLFRATNGEIFMQTGDRPNCRYCPLFYPVHPGQIIRTNAFADGSAAGIVYYDENKNFISSAEGTFSTKMDVDTVIPESVYYVRFCTQRQETYGLHILIERYKDWPESAVIQEMLTAESEKIRGDILSGVDVKYDTSNIKQGLLNATNGSIGYISGNYPNYRYCVDYFQVVPNGKIKVTAVCSGSYAGVIFYNADKTFLSSYAPTASNMEVNVPANAYYARICSELYTISGLAITAYSDNVTDDAIENSRKLFSSGGAYKLGQEFRDDVYALSTQLDIVLDTSVLEQGLINKVNGVVQYATGDYPNYKYTPNYYPVRKNRKILTNASCQGSFAAVCFYDANKNFLSAIEKATSSISEVVVPDNDNIAFARFCTEKYNITGGIDATLEAAYPDPLKERVSSLEGIVGVPEEYTKPYFGINRDAWIANEDTKNFSPTRTKITQKYSGEVSPEKRFIALGFDDFRATDFSLIVPLLEKYGARAVFNQVRNNDYATTADKNRINSLINGGHEVGDHTWKHYKFPFDEPLFNGQDPSSPEGSQVPFPSNSQLRDDAGDGKNVFGYTLTNNVKTDLGYQAPDINTTWSALTDAQCQQLRDYYSVMKDTSTNLVVLLDSLSNMYLGTTGSSRNSWDALSGEYTGGIFTGCKTSQNHEIWERILLVTNMFLKDKFGLNFDLLTWSLPGSKASGCTFPYNGARYYDASHTKRVGNLARFASSLYKNNDGTEKERSWTDVLREFGYRTTHDATPTTRDYCMRYQFIMNASQSRPDALPHPTNRLLSYSKIATEYTEGTDLTGTKPYEVQMYDGGASPSTKNSFRNEIEQWRHYLANGVIWGAVIDSQDTWSERMILEGLLKYGAATGIEFVTHGEAYDICFNHRIKDGNLIYNPRLRNTAKEFMPTAVTVPSNPDGYVGNCSVSVVDGTPVLSIAGVTYYEHYGIPYGRIKYSADVKGNGTITIRAIKNNTQAAYVGSGDVLATITINNNDFEEKVSDFVVADNGMTAYEDVFGGYGEKIIGLYIEYSAGLQIKNIDLRLV